MSETSSLNAVSKEEEEEEGLKTKEDEQRPNNLTDLLKRNNELNLTDTCSICLLQVQQDTRGYTNTCFHCFCFECIFEWSKVKAICPLCKSQFKLIYYDIKTVDDYKEFKIKSSSGPLIAFNRLPLPHVALEMNTTSFIHRICSNTPGQWIVNRHSAPERFRLNIYLYKMYVSPNEIEILDEQQSRNQRMDRSTSIVKPTHYRDINAKFYRLNAAQTHRLNDFLKREISVLKRRFRVQPRSLQEADLIAIIINLVKKYDINSKEFYNSILNHIKPNHIARHFQHEFFNYARSPSKSLAEYDGLSVYYTFNFTRRVDMSVYRRYDENINICSTHVRTLPAKETGDVDDLLEFIAKESSEVIKIEDEEEIIDGNDDDEINESNDIEIVPSNERSNDASEIIIIPLSPSLSLSNNSTSATTTSRSEIIAINSESSSSSLSNIFGEDDEEEFNLDDEDDSSSYCEEISAPSKPSPDCIYLSSDEDKPTSSILKRKTSNQYNNDDEDEEEDEDKPTTSKNAVNRKKRKNEDFKEIVKIKFSSESQSESDEDEY